LKATPRPGARAVDQILRRLRKMPVRRNDYVIERGLRTPTRDGAVLLGDLYSPANHDARTATILIRTPYGRGLPVDALWGPHVRPRAAITSSYRVCAARFGSTGTFRPMAQEADDAQDTVAWLRQQPWFNGNLATMGMSYVAFTQWRCSSTPPPELRASVMVAGPARLQRLHLGQRRVSGWRPISAGPTPTASPTTSDPAWWGNCSATGARVNASRPPSPGLPLATAGESLLEGRAPWYREWLDRTDLADPYWQPYAHTQACNGSRHRRCWWAGWQDVFVGQTVAQYEALRARGVEVAMTLGPWTHVAHVSQGPRPSSTNEALDWLDTHLGHPGARQTDRAGAHFRQPAPTPGTPPRPGRRRTPRPSGTRPPTARSPRPHRRVGARPSATTRPIRPPRSAAGG